MIIVVLMLRITPICCTESGGQALRRKSHISVRMRKVFLIDLWGKMKRCLQTLILIVLCGLCSTSLMAQDTTDSAYTEALRRIEEARVSGGTYLDLRELALEMLPPEIGQLPKLQTLDLSNNELTTLPPEIGQLSNLKSLCLNFNRITTLPPEIGNLKNLKYLLLDSNQITVLPPQIGHLKNLFSLDMGHNQLTTLPLEIGQLTNLQFLMLPDNQLTTLPEIGQLGNLIYLNLANNHLTALPLEIVRLSNLQAVSLMNNPVIFPPLGVVQQGPISTANYLHDLLRQTIAAIATGIGGITGLMLAFRWRQWRGLGEKKKRL